MILILDIYKINDVSTAAAIDRCMANGGPEESGFFELLLGITSG